MGRTLRAALPYRAFTFLLIALAPAGAADDVSSGDPADVRLGVAQFEASGPPGVELPDVATLLADRIGTRGVGRIVGPAELGAPAEAEPNPSDVIGWASKGEVDAVVVGRTTAIGSLLSLDVRLMSGASGELIGTYISEVARSQQLATAVESLAGQIIDGTITLAARTKAPAPSPKPKSTRSGADGTFGIFDNDAPISIKSDSLEASEVNGRRRLVFDGHVRVVQAGVRMTSNRLTADYPEGSSQPSRLVASGAVRVSQRGQEARCDRGIYKRAENLLECCGNAQLRDGVNLVRGTCIEFDLAAETVHVENAEVSITPGGGERTAAGGDAP